MRTPDDHLARLGNVVGISQATLRAHVALYGQQLDTLAAMRLERQRLLQMAGPGAPADPEVRALMHKRIRDLELRIEGPLAECIAEVEGELAAHGITWRPLWSIGCAGLVDGEFWTADRANTISIPWYLANQQLWASVNEVKVRYTKEDVMRVLRHEVGHALGYAFELWRLVSWTKAFGDFEQPYKDEYVPDPASTGYVRYLHETGPSINAHYAQKHPDEDWAETFATWIDPGVDWKARYPEGTGARAKLDFVDRLLVEQGMAYGDAPNHNAGRREPYTREPGTVGDFVGGWGAPSLWSPASALLRSEVGIETKARLHDLYFEGIGGAKGPPSARLANLLGGYPAWERELRACAAASGGWAVTCWDVVAREARTFMLTDEQGIPPDLTPLLVLDLVEHSYWGEYPGRKDLYVAAWLRNLDWGWVEQANLPAGV